jgi:cell division protein FtsQ
MPAPAQPVALRMLAWCVAAAMIAAALLPLAPRLGSSAAPLTLAVEGDFRRVTPEEVRAAAAPALNTDFYGLDLAAVRARVETLPWVAAARVERMWPGTVRVSVREHWPYARWGEHALLSQDGAVFTPAAGQAPDGLPELAGPDGQQLAVRDAFETLREKLAGTDFVPRALSQNARGEWTAVTHDGIELRLGRGAPEQSVALLAGPVRTALAGRLQEVAYVDLHYINGFAVGWRVGGSGSGAGPPDTDGPPGGHD